MTTNTNLTPKKKDGFFHEITTNIWLYMLIVPAIILTIIFKYIPLIGIIIAFQDFNPIKGMFGSKFIGFDNFKYFFRGSQWLTITFNTLYLVATISVETSDEVEQADCIINVVPRSDSNNELQISIDNAKKILENENATAPNLIKGISDLAEAIKNFKSKK